MSDITYTRITPEGEEKCSLRNGDGMTIEEKVEMISEFCEEDERDCCDCIIDTPCAKSGGAFDRHPDCCNEAYNILVNAGLIKPPVNFTKVNPDDEIDSEGDAVNHPNHYTQNGIECIDAIRASMTADGFMDYCKGNVLKYIWRWRDKGGAEDLHKARVYLDWLIEEADK